MFYSEKATKLEDAGQFFMSAVALAFALETAILTHLLVEFDAENGGELKIPDSVNMSELIEAATEIGVLNAPINLPSHLGDDDPPPKYVAKDVADKTRRFRNLIHPARALRMGYDSRRFSREDLQTFEEMYRSITHSLLYYL